MHKWSIHVLRLQMYTDQVHAPVPIRSSPGLTRTRTSRRHCTAMEEGKDLHDIRTANHTATKHRTPTAHESYVCTPCRTFGATCGNVYDRSRRLVYGPGKGSHTTCARASYGQGNGARRAQAISGEMGCILNHSQRYFAPVREAPIHCPTS